MSVQSRTQWRDPKKMVRWTSKLKSVKQRPRPRGDLRPGAVGARFSDEDEVVARVNDSAYGLSAHLHTRDVARAHRLAARFEVGSVVVNAFSPGSPTAPFGGVKNSGFGREGGRAGIDEVRCRRRPA